MYNNSHKDLVSINQYRAHKFICKNRMLYKFATTNGNFLKMVNYDMHHRKTYMYEIGLADQSKTVLPNLFAKKIANCLN